MPSPPSFMFAANNPPCTYLDRSLEGSLRRTSDRLLVGWLSPGHVYVGSVSRILLAKGIGEPFTRHSVQVDCTFAPQSQNTGGKCTPHRDNVEFLRCQSVAWSPRDLLMTQGEVTFVIMDVFIQRSTMLGSPKRVSLSSSAFSISLE